MTYGLFATYTDILKHRKYGQFLSGVVKLHSIRRIKLFEQLIGINDCLSDEEVDFVIKAKQFLLKRKIGISVKQNSNCPEFNLVPFIRTIAFIRYVGEDSITKQEMESLMLRVCLKPG